MKSIKIDNKTKKLSEKKINKASPHVLNFFLFIFKLYINEMLKTGKLVISGTISMLIMNFYFFIITFLFYKDKKKKKNLLKKVDQLK